MYKLFFGGISRFFLTIICTLVFICFIYSFVKYFISPEYFKLFYLKFVIIIGITFVFLLLLIFFLNDTIIVYSNISFFSLLISLFMVEIFFNINGKNVVNDISNRSEKAKKLNINFDTRSKFEFYQDYKKIYKDAVPSIPPNDFFLNYKDFKNKNDLYAISGISKKNTVFCNEGGERIVYFSDRHGFRNNDSFWDLEEIDIVLLGDSLAQGACVSDKDTIHQRIIHYTKKSFLNLGYQGHGPLMQLASLKEYASKKKPKKVIWFYSETNDIDNLIYEHEWDIFNKYLYDKNFSQNLINKQSQIDNDHEAIYKEIYSNRQIADRQKVEKKKNDLYFEIRSIVKLYNLRNFISHFIPRRYSLTIHGYSPLNTFDTYEKIIDKAINITNSWGGKFYFVYYPHAARYFESVIYPYPLRKYDYMKKKNFK